MRKKHYHYFYSLSAREKRGWGGMRFIIALLIFTIVLSGAFRAETPTLYRLILVFWLYEYLSSKFKGEPYKPSLLVLHRAFFKNRDDRAKFEAQEQRQQYARILRYDKTNGTFARCYRDYWFHWHIVREYPADAFSRVQIRRYRKLCLIELIGNSKQRDILVAAYPLFLGHISLGARLLCRRIDKTADLPYDL